MANLQAIRQALATQLQNGLGITSVANMPATITPPMIMVLPGSPYVTYGQTFGETIDAEFGMTFGEAPSPGMSKVSSMLVVLIVISMAMGYEPMQPALDTLIEPPGNPGSVPTVIAMDETIGGAVEFAVPIDVSGYGLVSIAGQDYFGAHLRVQIGA